MSNYIEIKKEDIILFGITHHPLSEHRFIVYIDKKRIQKQIRVNTDYYEMKNGIYHCCMYYDRGLCDTIAEYRNLTIEIIEEQAYGSWMDGAR